MDSTAPWDTPRSSRSLLTQPAFFSPPATRSHCFAISRLEPSPSWKRDPFPPSINCRLWVWLLSPELHVRMDWFRWEFTGLSRRRERGNCWNFGRKNKPINQSTLQWTKPINQSMHWSHPVVISTVHYRASRSTALLLFPLHIFSAHVASSNWPAVKILLSTAFFGLLGVMPFALFQLHGYSLFCRPFTDGKLAAPLVDYANERGYIYLDPRRGISQWCKNVLPLAYSHVQASHWHVGLFQYYQVKQIPNFVLALPIVVLSLWSLWRLFIWGGKKLDEALLPYGIHLAFMLTFCVFFIHIQVHVHSIDWLIDRA